MFVKSILTAQTKTNETIETPGTKRQTGSSHCRWEAQRSNRIVTQHYTASIEYFLNELIK